jgi:hypothetical protein
MNRAPRRRVARHAAGTAASIPAALAIPYSPQVSRGCAIRVSPNRADSRSPGAVQPRSGWEWLSCPRGRRVRDSGTEFYACRRPAMGRLDLPLLPPAAGDRPARRQRPSRPIENAGEARRRHYVSHRWEGRGCGGDGWRPLGRLGARGGCGFLPFWVGQTATAVVLAPAHAHLLLPGLVGKIGLVLVFVDISL